MSADEYTLGKYRLIVELGHGGMADVFLAVAHGPGGFSKLTVIKRLRAGLAEDPNFVAMLIDEARLAARLNHPNVVQTYEIGNVGSQYFIAMEYLEGQPLHRITHRAVKKNGSFDPYMHYGIIVEILAGLHHAHELLDFDGSPLGVVHRDVSPHNVFVTYEGQVKVVDFGIAKAVGRTSAETQTGVIKGKVSYMSPEQAKGREIDPRADVFSVGVMLFEAAVGQRFWKGLDDISILGRLVTSDIPGSPRAVDPNCPEKIDEICRKALAADVKDRYASAADMQADLEQFLWTEGKRPAARELGKFVTGLFEDRRKEIRDIIEGRLDELKSAPHFSTAPMPLPTETGSLPGSKVLKARLPTAPLTDSPEDGAAGSLTAQTKVLTETTSETNVPALADGGAGSKARARSKTALVVGGGAVIGVVLAAFMAGRSATNRPAGHEPVTTGPEPSATASVAAATASVAPSASAIPNATATASASATPTGAPTGRPIPVANPNTRRPNITQPAASTAVTAVTPPPPVTTTRPVLEDDGLNTRK